MRFLIALVLLLTFSGHAQVGVTTRNFNTNYFQIRTNVSPYDITINTNAGSAASSWVTNLSGGPQVWTNDPANIIRPVNQPSRLLWDSVLSTNGPSTTEIINEVDSSSGYESYAYSELQSSLNLSADLPFARLLLSSVATNGAELDLTMSVNANDSGTPFFAFDDHSFGLVPLLRIMPDGNLSYIRKLQYSWPLTNALPGQVLASDGGTPQQVYWTNLSSGGGSFVTNAITTNTPAGMTNVIVSVINNNFGYHTNFATTNTSAGLTNAILSALTNNNGLFVANGRTNFFGMFSPNTNLLSWTNTLGSVAMFATNGTGVGIRNGDTPDGSSAVDLKIYGNYGSASTFDDLAFKWSVSQGAYQILTEKATSGTTRVIQFGTGGTPYWDISAAGHLLPVNNNQVDIGAGSDGIRDLWVIGRVVLTTTGTAGVGQIGNVADGNAATINFQGSTIGLVNNFSSSDIFRFYVGGTTIGGVNRTALSMGNSVLTAGANSGVLTSFFGQDPLNTANRWQMGSNNITAGTQGSANQIIGPSGSGSHIWGGDLGIYGGPSTGSGTNGSLILGTAEGGSAISTQNTPKIRTYIAPEPVTLTESTATLICTVSNITAAHFATVMVVASTFASDGTDHQSVGESFIVSCVNKGGTLTATVSASSPMSTTTSAGTLTTAYTAVANANGFDLKNNAVSSLTQTKLNTRWRIESIDSDTTPFIFDSAGKHQ